MTNVTLEKNGKHSFPFRFLPDSSQAPQDIPPELPQGRSRSIIMDRFGAGGVPESCGGRSLQGRSLRKRGNSVNHNQTCRIKNEFGEKWGKNKMYL